MNIARTAALAVTTAVLSLGATPVVSADTPSDTPSDTPCATQETQVAKAEAALARVTAVFAHQKDQVAKWQERLDAATTPEEQARIEKRLNQALAKKADAKFAKKAQQKRLAKANERLAECEAANA